MDSPDLTGLTILYLVTEDWYFCSHRLGIARAARDAGARVIVATRTGAHRGGLEAEGFAVVPLPWRRRSRNLLQELAALSRIVRAYRKERPDVVHHVAVKPAVYGGVAAALSGHPRQVNAIAGFGYVSTSTQLRARVLRPVVRAAYRRLLDRPEARVVVQNPDDEDALVSGRLFDASRVRVIRGSGVDVSRFRPTPPAPGPVTAMLAARMLWSKGVGEAVEASRLLRARGSGVRVVLVGDPDDENPETVPRTALCRWVDEGLVEWRGHREDMAAEWATAHVGLLPSYREGLPKSLLEAAACALPLVAADVPGCREIVRDGENGILVPARSAAPIADALERLEGDAGLRRRMGEAGRALVERHFAERIVIEQTLALYAELTGRAHRG